MIKSVLKTAGAMVAGGALVFALTYNSKMPEIKAGIDSLKQITIEARAEADSKDSTVKELTSKLDALKKEHEELQKEYNRTLDNYDNYVKQCIALEKRIKELESELAQAKGDILVWKDKADYFEKEYNDLLNSGGNKPLVDELNKANKEIEKANSEQKEILNYIENAIKEVNI